MIDSYTLYLLSGVCDGIGYWKIDFTNRSNSFVDSTEEYLECYRQEVIGLQACIEIRDAINRNIDILVLRCIEDGYKIVKSNKGKSFDIPLIIIEDIFDFWFNIYKDNIYWKTSLGLISLLERQNSIHFTSKGLKGKTAECVKQISQLISYRPPHYKVPTSDNLPMWK